MPRSPVGDSEKAAPYRMSVTAMQNSDFLFPAVPIRICSRAPDARAQAANSAFSAPRR